MAATENLTVTVSDGDPAVVTAEGQIDSFTSTSLDEVLAALPADRPISVDLSGVDFVDSSGLRVIVRAHKRQLGGGSALTIVKPSQPVSRLLDMTGLTSELTISL
ncbi:MAG: STAS domain-containing protein [Acidimicrobiales bacterium]